MESTVNMTLLFKASSNNSRSLGGKGKGGGGRGGVAHGLLRATANVHINDVIYDGDCFSLFLSLSVSLSSSLNFPNFHEVFVNSAIQPFSSRR